MPLQIQKQLPLYGPAYVIHFLSRSVSLTAGPPLKQEYGAGEEPIVF